MTLTRPEKFAAQYLVIEIAEDTVQEPGADEAEATHMSDTTGVVTDSPHWTYSGTTEDNGTPGILDGQQGLTYSGPSGVHVQISVAGVDTVEHAITAPEATDKACLCVFRNSEIVGFADEGFVTHASEIATEFNIDTQVVLQEGDVIRVGCSFQGEEADADLDLAPGIMTITG